MLAPPAPTLSAPSVPTPSAAALEALVGFEPEAPTAPPASLLTTPPTTEPAEKPMAFTTVIPAIDIPPVQPISLTTPIKLFDPSKVGSGDGEDPAGSANQPSYKAWLAEQKSGGPKARKRPVSGRGSTSVGGKVMAFAIAGIVAAIAMFAWRQLSGDDTPAPVVPVVSTPTAGG